MKKVVLVMILSLLPVPGTYAFTIITDPNVFYSFFEKPKTTIEFSQLRDGTTFSNIPDGLEPITSYAVKPACAFMRAENKTHANGSKSLAVRPNAFSSAWFFKVKNPENPDSYCDAVLWSDQGLSIANNSFTVVAASGQSQPFVLYTNKGFIGILPDDPQETIFILDRCTQVFIFETEFSRTASVLESGGSLMAYNQDDHAILK